MRAVAMLAVAAVGVGQCGVLSQLDSEMTALAEKALESVVTIEASVERPAPRFLEAFPEWMPRLERMMESERIATGFVWREGYVLTLARAVEGASDILVRWEGGSAPGELVGVDKGTNLAVVRIVGGRGSGPLPPPLGLASSASVRPGSVVLLCGNLPGSLQRSVIVGTVAGLGRHGVPGVPVQSFIQIQAPISPGMGGGPVLDVEGRCVGVVYAVVLGGGLEEALREVLGEALGPEPEPRGLLRRRMEEKAPGPPVGRGELLYYALARHSGAGFAVPGELAARVAEGIVEGTGARWGYLGVEIRETPDGVVVDSVEPGSPAEEAGLRPGDLIESYDGAPVRHLPDLVTAVATSEVGTSHSVGLLRGGERLEVTVSVTARPDAWERPAGTRREARPGGADRRVLLGAVLCTNSAELAEMMGLRREDGVVVVRVALGSDADLAGLRGGDVITAANDQAVRSPEQLERIARASRELRLTVDRDGEILQLRIIR